LVENKNVLEIKLHEVIKTENNVDKINEYYNQTKQALKEANELLKKADEKAKTYIAVSKYREEKEKENQRTIKLKTQKLGKNALDVVSLKNVPSLLQLKLNQDLEVNLLY
jgi:hypothetical protein